MENSEKKKYDIWLSLENLQDGYGKRSPLHQSSYAKIRSYAEAICYQLSVDEIQFFANMRGLAQGKEEGFKVYAKISLLSSCDPTKKIKEILQNSLAKDVEQRKKYNLLLQDKVQVLETKPEVDTEVWESGNGFGGWWKASHYSELFTEEEYKKLQKWHNLIEAFGNGDRVVLSRPYPEEVNIYKKELELNQPQPMHDKLVRLQTVSD